MRLRIAISIAAIVSSGFLSSALATNNGHAWLMKMTEAAERLDYDGYFVYQHDDQLESMRIIHKVDRGSVLERLISLNGAPREIIRDNQEVRCYLPDENSVMVGHRRAKSKSFPSVLPDDLRVLDRYYSIRLGRKGRVTGRLAQLIIIKPVDNYRYGYRLWADTKTGLLLKADLVNAKGKVLEQFMFTTVKIGGKIAQSDLVPGMSTEKMVWRRMASADKKNAAVIHWRLDSAPKGFSLSAENDRMMPDGKKAMNHLVYSDGLAAVSVFVEKVNNASKSKNMQGVSKMGAVHAYRKRINGHQITVVGEVPARTVEAIARAVVRR